jgi:sugar lactone lactonase YvrE
MSRYLRTSILGVFLAGLSAAQGTSALASTPPVTRARIVAHFDITARQQPENITLEPNGAADLTFSFARQVARVTPQGKITILATLPPAVSGTAGVSGVVRAPDGTLYVNYLAGAASGIWRIRPGGTPHQVVALPAVKFLNGLALDPRSGALFATDSGDGTVWRAWPRSGKAELWATGEELRPGTRGLGANGIKVHNGSVWVSNTDQGTLLRIPVRHDGTAGPIVRVAQVTAVDDFAFTGSGNTVLAAQNALSQVELITPGGAERIVLTSADALSNPTSVAVRGPAVYVPSAAYSTGVDPNLLLAHLDR